MPLESSTAVQPLDRPDKGARAHGSSLAQDAWRRLRQNWPAMFSLGFLLCVCLLALLTPLLPLQPPRTVRLAAQYTPPTWSAQEPWWIASADLPATLDQADAAKLLADGFGAPLPHGESNSTPAREDALGPVSVWLLHRRVEWFGNWSLNSLCGTDSLGRDLLARIAWGTRVSLLAALIATLVSLSVGVVYGATAGYLGGWVDNLMMRVVDILYAIPLIFVAIFLISILDAENYQTFLREHGIGRMTIVYLVIGALYWLTMARVVRGQVLALKEQSFVEAARALGAGPAWIIRRHLIPNVLGVVIVYLTLTIPSVMLTEAFLSFLGLGVRVPDVSWGILADEGIKVITPIKIYWWLIAFPALAMSMTLYSLNFLGDGLRDALDPRLKMKA
jgi:oligopeptide transport system permease protein